MVIGIPIPIVFCTFFTPSKTRPSDLDLERKRRGPQPPNPPPDAWSGDQRLSFFSNRRALALPEPGGGIFVISTAQTSSPGGGACRLT
jgi:hypothetical protein